MGQVPLGTPVQPDPTPRWLDQPAMRYPNAYVWLIFLASLDIMLTWVILRRGGTEVNPVAREVIDAWGLPGATLFKFALILLVIVLCEVIGRRRDRTARALVGASLLISLLPVAWSLALLALHGLQADQAP